MRHPPHLTDGTPLLRSDPRPDADAPLRHEPEAESDARSGSAVRSRNLRLLVVDDHPAVRRGLTTILDSEQGLTVVGGAAGARECVEVVARTGPDVVLLDYHLPDQDGLTACMWLKGGSAPPRVLVCSAFADETLAALALVAGADGIASKAAGAGEIARAVRAVAAGQGAFPELSPSVLSAEGGRPDAADVPIFGMISHGVAPADIAEVLGLSDEWLRARRWAMLRRLQGGPPEREPRRSRPDAAAEGRWPHRGGSSPPAA